MRNDMSETRYQLLGFFLCAVSGFFVGVAVEKLTSPTEMQTLYNNVNKVKCQKNGELNFCFKVIPLAPKAE